MSVLATIGAMLRDLASRGLSTLEAMLEGIRAFCAGDAETRRRVAFSVAMIALSAKMAKADGVVSQREVDAFRRIFAIPPDEIQNVFRLYDLAAQDTAGFEAYAARIAALCDGGSADQGILVDVLDGLFHIAGADGHVHERELVFLRRIGEIFEVSRVQFAQIEARHVRGEARDAYAILGVEPDDPPEAIRRNYLKLVRENHPDRLVARGVPEEFLAIATERMKSINAAFASISRVPAH